MREADLMISKPTPEGPGTIEKIVREVITLGVVLAAFGVAWFLW